MGTLKEIRNWAKFVKPVFVCGLERSGTSMLQVSLSRHPALFPLKDVYETFVFAKPRNCLEVPPPYMTAAYLQGGDNAKAFRALVDGLRKGDAEVPDADLIRAFFYFCAHQVYPDRRPLEKTPAHVRHLGRMLDLFPRARIIVCTRDPVSVVASYRKRLAQEKALGKPRAEWGWLDRTADQLVAHFRALSEPMERAREQYPEQVFIAPYDWLTGSPEPAMQQLCEFAALPFVPEVMRPSQVAGRKVDVLLSQPITRREPDDARYVDEPTAAMIRTRMQDKMPLWNSVGTAAVQQPAHPMP
jgi:hypothetical protein